MLTYFYPLNASEQLLVVVDNYTMHNTML